MTPEDKQFLADMERTQLLREVQELKTEVAQLKVNVKMLMKLHDPGFGCVTVEKM